MPPPKPLPKPGEAADYWKQFEGIPLCHTPRTDAEWKELDAKGACRCG